MGNVCCSSGQKTVLVDEKPSNKMSGKPLTEINVKGNKMNKLDFSNLNELGNKRNDLQIICESSSDDTDESGKA